MSDPNIALHEDEWYYAELEVKRDNRTGTLRCVFAAEELEALRDALQRFHDHPDQSSQGSYSYADTADEHQVLCGVSGQLRIAYAGVTITAVEPLPNYTPPSWLAPYGSDYKKQHREEVVQQPAQPVTIAMPVAPDGGVPPPPIARR